jgi:hypothetical protein
MMSRGVFGLNLVVEISVKYYLFLCRMILPPKASSTHNLNVDIAYHRHHDKIPYIPNDGLIFESTSNCASSIENLQSSVES